MRNLGVALVIISSLGVAVQPNYYEPWQSDYHEQFNDVRIKIAAHGLLSPSAHNTQPWIIKLKGNNPLVFSLFTDAKRLLPETDPHSRQITISQGTFLETGKIAANQLGYNFEYELFPEGEYSQITFHSEMNEKPVARIFLSDGFQNSIINSQLYDEIFHRVTNRTPYFGEPLNDDEMTELQSLNDNPKLRLVFFNDTESLDNIRTIAMDAVKVESTTKETMKETVRLFRDSEKEKKYHRDGITMMSGGLRGFNLKMVQFFSNLFPMSWEKMGEIWLKSETKNIQSATTFAMIISNDNSRTTQVKTGMLYARFQLKASTLGLSMQPLSQALQEYPKMSQLYNNIHKEFSKNGKTIQMLVRMGRANEVIHSPRRDVMDLIFK